MTARDRHRLPERHARGEARGRRRAPGFDAVELFENDLHRLAAAAARGARARAPSSASRSPSTSRSATSRRVAPAARANLRRAEAKFDVMEELGADLILVCSNVRPDAIDDDALAAAQLHELAERAARRGLRDRLRGARLGHARQHLRARVADRRARPTTRRSAPAWTPSTSSRAARTPPASARSRGEKIFFLQLADAPHAGDGRPAVEPARPLLPGSGRPRRRRRCCARRWTPGYAGPLSLEVFNDVFRAADPRRMAVDAMRSLLVLEDGLPRGGAARRVRVRRARRRDVRAEELSCGLGFAQVGAHPHQAGAAVAAGRARGSS